MKNICFTIHIWTLYSVPTKKKKASLSNMLTQHDCVVVFLCCIWQIKTQWINIQWLTKECSVKMTANTLKHFETFKVQSCSRIQIPNKNLSEWLIRPFLYFQSSTWELSGPYMHHHWSVADNWAAGQLDWWIVNIGCVYGQMVCAVLIIKYHTSQSFAIHN